MIIVSFLLPAKHGVVFDEACLGHIATCTRSYEAMIDQLYTGWGQGEGELHSLDSYLECGVKQTAKLLAL
jgi:hypothetical protein